MQINNSIAIEIFDNNNLIAHFDSDKEFVETYKKMIYEIDFLRERENKLQLIEQMFASGIIDLDKLNDIIRNQNTKDNHLIGNAQIEQINYNKYYQKGGNYLIPVEIFDDLLEEIRKYKKSYKYLQQKINNAKQYLEYYLIGNMNYKDSQKAFNKIWKELGGNENNN